MSEQPPPRLVRMLEALGLDPALVASGELPTIMAEVKERCSACQAGSACDYWLDDAAGGTRDFCPNARALDVLRKLSGAG
jgi:hypothetical protein